MNSNVIGTVYQLPDDKKNFASGRGAIYTLGSYAPTIITMGGGWKQTSYHDKGESQ